MGSGAAMVSGPAGGVVGSGVAMAPGPGGGVTAGVAISEGPVFGPAAAATPVNAPEAMMPNPAAEATRAAILFEDDNDDDMAGILLFTSRPRWPLHG
ncbi:MAG: hypothetical protein V9E98_07585 [Candidatus Nanopelagicales bacterium]